MNALKSFLTLAACAAVFALVAPKTQAQPMRMSPEEIRGQMMDKIRDRLEVKDDDEWRAISPKITKAMDAAQDLMKMRDLSTIMPDFGGGQRRRNNENGDNNGGTNGGNNNQDRPQRRRGGMGMGMFGGEPAPSIASLNKTIEDKAPKEDVKAKLAAARAEIKDKETKLATAREDLRGVLNSRQEAVLVVSGILD